MTIFSTRYVIVPSSIRASVFVACLFVRMSHAQEATAEQQAEPSAATSSLEVFRGPQFKDVIAPAYPQSELYSGVEGWVDIGFMVDPKGKPYELAVIKASGNNKVLQETALRAVKKWTFEPATVNGQPVDSSLSRKIVFRINGQQNGAQPQFVRGHRQLQKAFDAKDRPAADAALAQMKVQNLYEDAYYGLAQFRYAVLWGDQTQQLVGVRRAVAREESATYLPKDLFRSAVIEQLKLELQTQDFAAALSTWRIAQKAGVDEAVLAKFQPSIAQVRAVKTDDRSYKVSGHLEHGSWHYLLYKRKFRINVLEGRVSQIKLRCNNGYVFFQYDPSLEYQVAEKSGFCGMEVVGDADTRIELQQM